MAQRPPPLQAKPPRPTVSAQNQTPTPQASVTFPKASTSQPTMAKRQQPTVPNGQITFVPQHPYQTPSSSATAAAVAPSGPKSAMPIPTTSKPPNKNNNTGASPSPHLLPKLPMPPRPVFTANGQLIPPRTTTPSTNGSKATAATRKNPPMNVPPIVTGNQMFKNPFQQQVPQQSNFQFQVTPQLPTQARAQASAPGSTLDESTTPPAPPFSPILSNAPLTITKQEGDEIASLLSNMDPYNLPSVISKPPPAVPISESENTDVIALRAALSVLQMQKATAARDVRTLATMRQEALEDPDGYVKALLERINKTGANAGNNGLLDETVRRLVEGLWVQDVEGAGTEELAKAMGVELPDKDVTMAEADESEDSSEDEDDNKDEKKDKSKGRFPLPPKAQNIVRMPPVNWSKYQVVGDALDKMHEAERRKPAPGEVHIDQTTRNVVNGLPEEPYSLASPYQPFSDQVRMATQPLNLDALSPNVGPSGNHPMETRRAPRKHIG